MVVWLQELEEIDMKKTRMCHINNMKTLYNTTSNTKNVLLNSVYNNSCKLVNMSRGLYILQLSILHRDTFCCSQNSSV